MFTNEKKTMGAALTITTAFLAGCSHPGGAPPPGQSPPPPAAPAVTPAVSAAPAAAFQPYQVVNQPPPIPKVATHHNRVLRLTRQNGQVYLADAGHRYYHVGRDPQGHLYPVYTDPATRATYPLYYDSRRDCYYRIAEEDGHFYRGYVGYPGNRFYADEDDAYDHGWQRPEDRPIIVNTFNTYDDETISQGDGDHPHQGRHHNDDWLIAIPVIAAAYFALQPHHHHDEAPPAARPIMVNSHPVARPIVVSTHPQPPVIVRQSVNVTVINRNTATATTIPPPGGHLHSPRPAQPTLAMGSRPHGPGTPTPTGHAFPASLHTSVPVHPALTSHPLVPVRTITPPAPPSRPFLRPAVHVISPPIPPHSVPVHRVATPTAPSIVRTAPHVNPQPVVHVAPRLIERPVVVTHPSSPSFNHTAPRPAVHMTPPPAAHILPPPVVHAAPRPVAHIAPPVAQAAPRPEAHTVPPPTVHFIPRPVEHAAPRPVVHTAAAPRPETRTAAPPAAPVAPRPEARMVPHPSARVAPPAQAHPAPHPAAPAAPHPAAPHPPAAHP